MGVPLPCIHPTHEFKVADLASTAEIVVTWTIVRCLKVLMHYWDYVICRKRDKSESVGCVQRGYRAPFVVLQEPSPSRDRL